MYYDKTNKLNLNIDEMKKIKFFIATPMYGGMCLWVVY